jgi:outer membrane protein TolC
MEYGLMKRCCYLNFAVVTIVAGLGMPCMSNAQTEQPAPAKTEQPQLEYINFLDILPNAIEKDESLKQAKFDLLSAQESGKAAWSVWYPKADVTLNAAQQSDVVPTGANKRYNPTEAKLKITQKLWDFGEAQAGIKSGQLGVEQAELGVVSARNNAIKLAAQAYIGLKRAHAQYRLALETEATLKQQTGQQDFRLSRGAAVGTDVLQAKNALAGAVTARVAAQGGFERAMNDFRTRFSSTPENAALLLPIRVPNTLIPKSKKGFREGVLGTGDQLKRARLAFERARVNSEKSFAASFLPEFKASAEANYKGDAGGTLGGKTEYIGKVELTWPIELFGTQLNSYRSSEYKFEGATLALAKAQRDIENSISNSWIAFQTASASRSNIQNQVEIARQFLRLAQMEVKQGRGQMLLVVNAQNALVNAQKAFENNTGDYAVQVYNLLAQQGVLSVDALQMSAVQEDKTRAAAIEDYKRRVEKFRSEQEAKPENNSTSSN